MCNTEPLDFVLNGRQWWARVHLGDLGSTIHPGKQVPDDPLFLLPSQIADVHLTRNVIPVKKMKIHISEKISIRNEKLDFHNQELKYNIYYNYPGYIT